LCFCEIFPFLFHLFDFGVHVSAFTIDHDDAQIAVFVGERIFVGDDVDVSEFLQ
jgi:hypothetical protein